MNDQFTNHEAVKPVGAYFPEARLAEAWTPYQHLCMIFEPIIGLSHGTIFPELVRPYDRHPHTAKWY